MTQKIKVVVKERPNTVRVERLGTTHTAGWRNDESLRNVVGDESLLRAAMLAWDGQDGEWEISEDELSGRSQGWWTP